MAKIRKNGVNFVLSNGGFALNFQQLLIAFIIAFLIKPINIYPGYGAERIRYLYLYI